MAQVLIRKLPSERIYVRILKLTRAMADLAGTEHIRQVHLAEAVQNRGLDRRMT